VSNLVERIHAHPFFASLGPRRREIVADYAQPASYDLHERIFAEGAPADRFWLIERGLVALDMRVEGSGDVVVETLPVGTVLGWSWLYPPHRWSLGALTRQPVTAIVFDAVGVRERCHLDHDFGFGVLDCFLPVVVERMRATRLRLLDLYAVPTLAPHAESWP
jgi:CRP-like cAMP-binding protein